MSHSIDEIISLIFKVRRNLVEQSFKNQPTNFSFLHFISLRFIEKNNPVMREIADFLAITPPSATSLTNTLFSQGYIDRVADKDDRRVVRIVIAKKGIQQIRKCKEKMRLNMQENLSRLSISQQKNFIKILTKLIKP